MSSAILAWEFCIVAAISSRRQIGITNQRCAARLRYRPRAWMGSRLARRVIELLGRHHSRTTPKSAAA